MPEIFLDPVVEIAIDGRTFLDDIAAKLIIDDHNRLNRLFAEEALDPPILIWNAMSSQLPVPPLPFLLTYWSQLPRTRDIPLASAIDPHSMKSALGHVMLLDVLGRGEDFRYRVYGTNIAERSGFDMTGKRTSEIQTSGYVSKFFLAVYRAVAARRQYVYTQHNPPTEVSAETWDRLILPLADENGEVSRILVGNVAGPWRSTLVLPNTNILPHRP